MFNSHLVYLLGTTPNRPQGIRAIEPQPGTPQSQRGNLYILIDLRGESPVRNQVLRQMLNAVQDLYYSAGGVQSDVLRAAIGKAHTILQFMNRRSSTTDLRAGIVCAVLLNDQLTLASTGSVLAMVASQDRVEQFPTDPGSHAAPLGGAELPHLQTYRRQVQDGDVIFLGESDWILLTSGRVIAGALGGAAQDNRHDVADYLRRQSGNADVLGLLMVLERRRDARPIPTPPFPAAHYAGRSGLPTAVGATPPVHDVPPGSAWPERPHPTAASDRAGRPAGARGEGRGARGELPPANPPPATRSWAGLAAGLRRGGHGLRDLLQRILPDAEARREQARRRQANWVDAEPPPQPQPPAPQPAPRQQVFTPPQPASGRRARLFILLGLLIPLLVFAVVVALYQQQGSAHRAEAEKLLDLAESKLYRAQQALTIDDRNTARTLLLEAKRHLTEAMDLIGFTERINRLDQAITVELQQVLQIRQLYGLDVPLTRFPREAMPHRVVVVDQDAYVLDIGRQMVEHFRLDSGRVVVEEASGPVLREGDVIGGVTVGRLKDMAWQPRNPGYSDIASLLVLDHNNNVFRYNRVEGATYVSFAARERLGVISNLAVYAGGLYMADEQRNQIFRYVADQTGYQMPAERWEWFAPQIQVNLAGLTEMAIDGDIWLLTSDGTVLRYNQGQQVPFALNQSVSNIEQPVDMAVSMDDDTAIYVADAALNRIVVFDKAGNYRYQLQAAADTPIQELRGLYVDEANGTLFILTQSTLYQHPLPR